MTKRDDLIRAAEERFTKPMSVNDKEALEMVVDDVLAAVRSGLPVELPELSNGEDGKLNCIVCNANNATYCQHNCGHNTCLDAVNKSLDDLSV